MAENDLTKPETAPDPKPDPKPEPTPDPKPGQTVNRYKYERDIAARDARIKELEEAAKASEKSGDDLAKLRSDFDAYKAEQEAKAEAAKTSKALSDAGCINAKAAAALLEDHGGDVEKLKEAAPYLFKSDNPTKKTGGNPKGDPAPEGLEEKINRAFGFNK